MNSYIRKPIIVTLGVILVGTIWFGERSKRILPYSIIFYEDGMNCQNKCTVNKQMYYFKKAIYHDPNFSDAYYRLALIYEKIGEKSKSLEYFRKVTELDYRNALAYYKVGLQYFRNGDYERARRCFLQVYRREECPEDATYYLGLIHEQMKKYKLALEFYLSMVDINNEFAARVYPRLAKIYHIIGREDSLHNEVSRLRNTGKMDLADLLERSYKEMQDLDAAGASLHEVPK